MAGRRESHDAALKRWEALELLQDTYPSFKEFLYDGMTDLLGYKCSPVQQDIADYLQHGQLYRMIMAQRGQAKTTITAFYAVWRIIHDPSSRVLIFSAGGTMASEISNWVIQIIHGWDILSCLIGDGQAGDRSSVEAFDIHHSLKGLEKSPSVACLGITGNMQGKRADILIADDIESSKNASTEVTREQLMHRCKDFTSINQYGDIIYLGTPQSTNSIYNNLPSMGFDVRVWTGRYPNKEEENSYGEYLAPMIKEKLSDDSLRSGYGLRGDRGAPVDPIIMPEDELVKKEKYQGKAYFQLQYMLDTTLMDADRYPLRTKNLVVTYLNKDEAPLEIKWMPDEQRKVREKFGLGRYDFYKPFSMSEKMGKYTEKIMYIDPAGGGANGDETAYAVVYMLNGTLFLMEIGGVQGGFSEDIFSELSSVAYNHKVNKILVESNFANGGFGVVWKPLLDDYYFEESKGESKYGPVIEDDRASIQKELRIIDTLEPIMGRHSLIVNEEVLEQDHKSCQKYPLEKRKIYSLFFQLENITRDRGSLRHDDKLDALAGACKYFHEALMQNSQRMASKQQSNEMIKFFDQVNKRGFKNQYGSPNQQKGNTNLDKYNRYKGVRFK